MLQLLQLSLTCKLNLYLFLSVFSCSFSPLCHLFPYLCSILGDSILFLSRRKMGGFIGNIGESFQHQNWISWAGIFKEMVCSNRSVHLLGGHKCSWCICWLGDYTHRNSANTVTKDFQIVWHQTMSNLTDTASKASLRLEDSEVGIFE